MRMITIKQLSLRIALLVEMCAFGYVYVCGKNGYLTLQRQRVVVVDLHRSVDKLSAEVAQLEQEMYVWQTNDFYKEKIAREQLQMARKGDELFYIG